MDVLIVTSSRRRRREEWLEGLVPDFLAHPGAEVWLLLSDNHYSPPTDDN